jgi:hypothetical protein
VTPPPEPVTPLPEALLLALDPVTSLPLLPEVVLPEPPCITPPVDGEGFSPSPLQPAMAMEIANQPSAPFIIMTRKCPGHSEGGSQFERPANAARFMSHAVALKPLSLYR